MAVPKILVVGATGQIGRLVLNELQSDHVAGDLQLVGLARTERPAAFPGELRALDLNRAELEGLAPARAALKGIDRIFLLTGYDVRMMAQSKAIIDAALAEGVQHIVHLGAHAAPDTTVVHLGWHQLIEAYLAQSGMAFTLLHPTSLMQNLPMLFAVGGGRAGVFRHYLGAGSQSWVDAQDIAAVAAHVLRNPDHHTGKTYALGADNMSMDDITRLLEQITDRPWEHQSRPPEEFLAAVTAAGAEPVYMACVANIFRRVADGSVPDLEQVFDTVEQLLGRPAATMREFLEQNRSMFLS